MAIQLEHTRVHTNGITLHAVEAGPPDGPLVVLLHGFPEFWYGWRRQIAPLATAGYRVVVPDQRGYNLSDKPSGVGAYAVDRLAADVVGLIAARGRDRAAAVIGHDWGAAVAWWLALRHPSWLDRLAILNVPHPAVMMRALRRDRAQLRRSWYIFFFQLPWLPEASARAGDWRAATAALRATSRPGTFTTADLARYREAWSRPGAYTAMLNWYRAAVRRPPRLPAGPRVGVPTLMIWGARDRFLGRELAGPSIALCERGRLVTIEEASHWVQHEEAARVNDLLLDFLASMGSVR
jgi:pimeloyl-ACP methyl ester carboxylesterase